MQRFARHVRPATSLRRRGVATAATLLLTFSLVEVTQVLTASSSDAVVFTADGQVGTGLDHACAIGADGSARCWGANTKGQLGDGSLNGRTTPSPVAMPSGKTFTSISVGRQFTCAVDQAGAGWCWGDDFSGQLGDPYVFGVSQKSIPVAVSMPAGRTFSQISAGSDHACALADNGTAWCWGANDVGQLGDGTADPAGTPVAVTMGGKTFTALDAGSGHTCALDAAGAAWCWGRGAWGELGNGGLAYSRTPVAVSMPLSTTFARIAAGILNSCALDTNGNAWCWGDNLYGQIGNGTVGGTQNTPAAVSMGGKTFTQIAPSTATCARASDGTEWCWGLNSFGQVGDGTTTDRTTPTAVVMPQGKTFAQASGSSDSACAIANDGGLWCWGKNADGQVGDGTTTARSLPVSVRDTVVVAKIGSGAGSVTSSPAGIDCGTTCGATVADGETVVLTAASSVGSTFLGWSGVGCSGVSTTCSLSMTRSWFVTAMFAPSIDAGYRHTCAVSPTASYCWGQNNTFQGGNNQTLPKLTPFPISATGWIAFRQVSADFYDEGGAYGSGFGCGLAQAGTAWCWGNNSIGQLGDGTTTQRATPTLVTMPGGKTFAAVSAGGRTSCALATDGTGWCWGWNYNGSVGDGTTVDRLIPTAVAMPRGRTFSQISASNYFACALDSTGAAWCWGWNFYGTLGDGTETQRLVPSPVTMPSGRTFVQITTGSQHTCALATDGTVWCWGHNELGRVGNSNVNYNSLVPVNVTPAGRTLTRISAGYNHTCAVDSLGVVWCWGLNTSGQLGLGDTYSPRTSPQSSDLPGGRVAVDIAAGGEHTCAIASDSTVWCWGLNTGGQLGDGTTTNRTTAVAVGELLTVSKSGTGTGTVTSAPAGIDCGSTCTFRFGLPKTVTLTATATGSSVFTSWSAGCASTSGNVCTVLVDAAKTITATFSPAFALTVTKAGTGAGTVGSTPAGIDCGLTCSANYVSGTSVVLTATANTGSTFSSWGAGCASTSGNQCTVLVNAAKTITANFTLNTYALTIAKAGAGAGVVTSDIGGINCGGTCSATYNYNTSVTLTAAGSIGSVFSSWGAGCASTSGNQCTVLVDAAKTITANFALDSFALTVTKGGTGTGVVTSNTGGINCGVTCSATYASGASVVLTATANGGSTFSAWGAGCASTSGNQCTVLMDAAKTITANFTLTPTVTSYSTSPTGAAVTSGGIGASLYIRGTNFTAPASCRFNGTLAPLCQVVSSSVILTSVPSIAVATGVVVTVQSSGVTATGPAFSVTRAVAPTVTSFSPACGIATTVITINGTNLAGAASVKVGNQTLSTGWTVISATQLTIPMPSSPAAGTVAVTTAGGTGTSAATLGVCVAPTVTSITPTSQIAGLSVTLTGTNFTGTSSVSFNGTPAASFSVVSATSITAVVPSAASAGAITVTNPAGSASSPSFTPLRYTAVQISAGTSHSCTTVSSGGLRCWGLNTNGQIGDGTTTQRATSVAVLASAGTALTNVSTVSAGGAFTCAVISAGASGTARCWGQNANGQVGNGVANNTNLLYPSTVTTLSGGVVANLTGVTQVATGTSHACALLSGGTVYCWGLNTSGQLGDGTTTQRTRAVQVLGVGTATSLTGVTQIAARGSTTCALLSTGAVNCWGLNTNGQVGDNSTTNRTRPVAVSGLTSGVTQVAVGGSHTCAVKGDTTVVCWGLNTSRQVGDGTTTQRNVPTTVLSAAATNLTGVVAVAAGTAFTCARLSDQTMKCWGANANGQLGNNSTTGPTYAVTVLGTAGSGSLGSGTTLACGGSHVLAIAGGKLYSWGLNGNAQLGDNTTAQRLFPVATLGF